MKITGAEFKYWYKNHWPGIDWYAEELPLNVEDEAGRWVLDDDAIVDTNHLGFLAWQGDYNKMPDRPLIPISEAYEEWLKTDGGRLSTFVVTVPTDDLDEVKAYLKDRFNATIT